MAAIAAAFGFLSLSNYGGAQSAAIAREVVRRRRWISDDEFVEFRSLAQLAPGANSPNLAILVGRHLRGPAGALVAFVAATVPGVLIILALGIVALDLHGGPIAGALRGCAAAAVGATLANAIEMTVRDRRAQTLLVTVLVAAAVTLGHLALWIAVPAFVALALAIDRRTRS